MRLTLLLSLYLTAPAAADPLKLFDGKTLYGWKAEGRVRVEGGGLVLGPKAKITHTCDLGEGKLTLREEKGKVKPSFLPGSGRLRLENAGDAPARVTGVEYNLTGLKPIFNGKDLTGWRVFKGSPRQGRSKFTVTPDGDLRIQNGPGDIQTVKQWADFVLQLECKVQGKHLNSGVFFRCIPKQYQQGYEAQIRNQWVDDDRGKPVDYGTGGLYRRQPARRVVSSDNEWFTMTVLADGPHLATWVNGIQVTDWVDGRELAANARKGRRVGPGAISFQGHDPTTDLMFRDIRVRPLR